MDQESGLGSCLDPERAVVGPIGFSAGVGLRRRAHEPGGWALLCAHGDSVVRPPRLVSLAGLRDPGVQAAAFQAAIALCRGPVSHRRGVLRRPADSRDGAACAAGRTRALACRLGLSAAELPLCRAALWSTQSL